MTTLIPKYSQVTTANRTIAEKFVEILSVKDFGAVGDGTTDDTAAIQAAINSLPVAPTNHTGAVSLAANSQYKITAPLVLQRGQSLIGDGSSTIVADFTSWSGDLVAIKFVIQTSDSQASIFTCFSQSSYGFTLEGANNSAVVTTGMKFYTSNTIAVGVAVNNAYIGSIRNIVIQKFDTGIELLECWNSYFTDVRIAQCRQGVYVHGKSVNVFFNSLQITNAGNDNTSSVATTVGVAMYSGNQYSGAVEGRPEGFTFVNGLIYGHFNNLYLNNGLKMTFDSMIIDGAGGSCIVVASQDELVITNCYIYTGADGAFGGIYFGGVAVGTNASAVITNNSFVGNSPITEVYGIYFVNSGAARQGVTIANNNGFALTSLIYAILCPNYSTITNNYCEVMSGTALIYIQNGGDNTLVDGNSTSSTTAVPVRCHPATSANLKIGKNSAVNYRSWYAGSATLVAGATSVALPNLFYDAASGDNYIRPVTQAVPNGNAGASYVTEQTTNSVGTFTVGSALGSDIKIRYTTTAIPYSASL